MNREEKNRLTRRRIMDSALAEFASQGYGASSVNTIAASEQLSKGIIYHYFENKDELYLASHSDSSWYLRFHSGLNSCWRFHSDSGWC